MLAYDRYAVTARVSNLPAAAQRLMVEARRGPRTGAENTGLSRGRAAFTSPPARFYDVISQDQLDCHI
jgi:hypothetical protein